MPELAKPSIVYHIRLFNEVGIAPTSAKQHKTRCLDENIFNSERVFRAEFLEKFALGIIIIQQKQII